jgi:hypothetical protein
VLPVGSREPPWSGGLMPVKGITTTSGPPLRTAKGRGSGPPFIDARPAPTDSVPQILGSKGPSLTVYSNEALRQTRSAEPSSAPSGALPSKTTAALGAGSRPPAPAPVPPPGAGGRRRGAPLGAIASGDTMPESRASQEGSKKRSDTCAHSPGTRALSRLPGLPGAPRGAGTASLAKGPSAECTRATRRDAPGGSVTPAKRQAAAPADGTTSPLLPPVAASAGSAPSGGAAPTASRLLSGVVAAVAPPAMLLP